MTAEGLLPFVCPACRGPLETEETFYCPACPLSYPSVLGIPLLLVEPDRVLQDWAERLGALIAESDASTKELLKEAVGEGLLDRSRRRLIDTGRAIEARKGQVLELFARAGIEPRPVAQGTGESVESILSYVALVHRDFSWAPEVDETGASLKALLSILDPGFSLGKTLVLGAGTGRLAWDLGHALSERGPIVLLDINPLPFLIGERLRCGDTLELFEIPGHPRRSDGGAFARSLALQNSPKNLRYVFADGLDPPFSPETFDTILTPWFVDQVPADLATLLPKIRRLLKPGGSYIQHGPFVYNPKRTRPAHRYTADEFVQLLLQNGFEIGKAVYEPMRYLGSPVSTQSRTEYVLSLHARSPRLSANPVQEPAPDWLLDENLSVPAFALSPSFLLPHAVVRRALELVDGSRSMIEIAQALIEAGLLADDGTAVQAVRACLKVLWKARVSSDC